MQRSSSCTNRAILTLTAAVSVLLVACGDAVTDPVIPGQSAANDGARLGKSGDVVIQAAPVAGEFETIVTARTVASLPNCPFPGDQDEDGNWHIPPLTTGCIIVTITANDVPITQGMIVFEQCVEQGGVGLPAMQCNEKDGNGRWTRFHTTSSVDQNGQVIFVNGSALATGSGWRWTYKGQGSGVANHSAESFDIFADLEP